MDKNTSSSSITRQLQVVFAASILILLISSYASFYSNRKLIETSQAVNHTNEVMVNAEGLYSTIKEAESGQRGYIITNNTSFLQAYNNGHAEASSIHRQLKSLTSDNPAQQQTLDLIRPLIDKRFEQMQKVIEMGNNMSLQDRVALYANSHQEMLKGKAIMDELRRLIEEIKSEEGALLQTRIDKQETYIRYTPVMVIIAAILSVLISIMAYLRIKSDLDQRIKKQKEDEEKYRETSDRITVMEGITRQIASGNFSVRSLDEAKDDLGKISTALNEMANSLDTNFSELERRNWLQEGAVNIGKSMRGERFIKSLANKVISSVATYINAPIGTLYIADKDLNLRLQGTYAVDNAPQDIMTGKGLLGQAAMNREVMVVDQLPEDYIKISSSIGDTTPSHAIIVPLVYGDDLIGVMELGKMNSPLTAEIDFLKNNTESIAIGINAAINYERMQDLLEETQSQAEELQAQHNELENINTELEAQTEKLQASEEELKVQQEELQQANAELEERSRLLEEKNQQIVEKNIEVQRKAEELALSTKYKSEFLANMSHELRTPLNSILLLSRLLKENNENTLTSEQVEYAQVIQSSGNGLLALIDEILDLSKIEAGKMSLEYEHITVKEIVQDIQSLFEPIAKEKKLEFNVNIKEGTAITLETDKLRLEQVIKNLLSNALKFTRQGSVNLNISNNASEKGFIDFTVSDTGIGIPEEKQRLIFEAFQQADGSTRRKFGGTGLGLSISKELAKLLGGDLSVKSEPGKGSEFTITVPVAQKYKKEDENTIDSIIESIQEDVKTTVAVQNDEQDEYISSVIPENIPDDRKQVTAKDKAVLIIEDDTNFAKSLLDYTRKKGYKGIVAVRGDEGLELAKQYNPIGILLDIQLPVKSGWQVIEELKADPKTRHIPVHTMSSHSVKKESLLKGAINFIDKPVAFEQMQEIFNKLEHVLNRTSQKVLIVEENPKHAKALAYFLETFAINSEIKTTIKESVDALQSAVDCVILDMGIPDQRAYDTLEEIKKNPGLENLPIIIFTGKSLSMAEEQRIKQYADSIVVKTAHSYQRILDEISLFLHLVEEKKPKASNTNYRKLGALNDVLRDKTVLVVDDDVRNIFSLTKALENLNMNIVTAIDGKEAMHKLEEHKNIDVVLLDMMMPEMDGYETARRIRQNREWKRLPVIAVTAKAMTGDREKCIQAGASDYITKPVDIDQLLSLLRVWLYDKQ